MSTKLRGNNKDKTTTRERKNKVGAEPADSILELLVLCAFVFRSVFLAFPNIFLVLHSPLANKVWGFVCLKRTGNQQNTVFFGLWVLASSFVRFVEICSLMSY